MYFRALSKRVCGTMASGTKCWRGLNVAIAGVAIALFCLAGAGAQAQTFARAHEADYHHVAPGETMFRIAVRYGVSVESLAAANNITDPRTLRIGQKLIIPQDRSAPTYAGRHDFTASVARSEPHREERALAIREDERDRWRTPHRREDAYRAPPDHAREPHDDHAQRASHHDDPRFGREQSGPGLAYDRAREDSHVPQRPPLPPFADRRVPSTSGRTDEARPHDRGDARREQSPLRAAPRDLARLAGTMIEPARAVDSDALNSEMPAGYTILADLIALDLGIGQPRADAPALDLYPVYGDGPSRSPHLYAYPYLRQGQLLTGRGPQARYDLPIGRRTGSHPAGTADPLVQQLVSVFIALHNRAIDMLIDRHLSDDRRRYCHRECTNAELAAALPASKQSLLFEDARESVIHYYHRVIVEDYLPRLIGDERARDILINGRDFYVSGGFRREDAGTQSPALPPSFAEAAFFYRKSQLRETYVLREGVRASLRQLAMDVMDRRRPIALHQDDLIDWRYFLDITATPPEGFNFARRIDPLLTPGLQDSARIPVAAEILERGAAARLPSGQDVALQALPALRRRGVLNMWEVPHQAQGEDYWRAFLLAPDRATSEIVGRAGTPVWYYILQEAHHFGAATDFRADTQAYALAQTGDRRYASAEPGMPHSYGHREGAGHTLGPVGSVIVGEVLVGLVEHYGISTGRGLAFRPPIEASVYGERDKFGLTRVRSTRGALGERYLMRNLIIDAGLAGPLR
jgi:hypothetical protein